MHLFIRLGYFQHLAGWSFCQVANWYMNLVGTWNQWKEQHFGVIHDNTLVTSSRYWMCSRSDSVVEFLIALGHLPSPLPPTYRQHLTGLSSQQQQVFQAISRPISSSVEMKRNERNLCTLAFILFQCISVALYAALVTFNAHTEWRNWTALNWHGLVFDELTKWASSNALQ